MCAALFCVYWLARIGIDGERGFSFGVDNDWTPRPIPTPSTEGGALEGDAAKRKKFHDNCDWRLLQQARPTIRAIRRNSAQFGAIRRNSAQFSASTSPFTTPRSGTRASSASPS